ncbi:MAG: DUF2760 domain-containing protein [Syntrophobacteraceae bacterium]
MRAKRGWTVLSFFTCFFWNLILLAAIFYAAKRVLGEMHHLVNPLLATGSGLSENVRSALAGMNQLIAELQKYLAVAVIGAGATTTLLLWLSVMAEGRRLANRAALEAAPSVTAKPAEGKAKPKAGSGQSAAGEFVPPSPQAAVQMLSLFQREGRLIDFLQEDLGAYEDAQIGAAVRNIHQGCRDVLNQHVELKPVYEQSEGVAVTVAPGFDTRAVRLTGNVTGEPPFTGILRHRGWRILRIELPKAAAGAKDNMIVAPAEIEIE